jgi:protoheme IX farnesyltransferase
MSSQPHTEALDSAVPGHLVRVYLELAKARLATLVVLTTVAGFVLASAGDVHLGTLLWAVVGTALTAFGANILNQCVEVERDRKMHRTRTRPLPAGDVTRSTATVWGVVSALVGLVVLLVGTNTLTAGLAALVILLYLLAYTPMKVLTPFNTVVGAVCGAIPPVMGWTAAAGRIEAGAWVLFGVLFLWQIPHFLALAWMYRDDYARGGFRMLSAVDTTGALTGRVAVVYALALLPVSVAAVAFEVSGALFLALSVPLGAAFALLAWQLMLHGTERAARRLFLASLIYLPLVLGLMVADATGRTTPTDFEARSAAVADAVAG